MRIVFMGTPDFALPALERLLESSHQVVLIVTQPDRPAGRGRKVEASPVKRLAEARGLPVVQPASARRGGLAEAIRDAAADLAVVAAFGQILPREVLDAPRLGCINIHPSLLPAYRGAAPVPRCILDGREETGVTLIMLTDKLDGGPIVAQQRIEILDDDDARSVLETCAVMGADMLVRVIDEAQQSGRIESTPQDDSRATLAPAIKKEEGMIPWDEPTMRIMYRLRAMTPWPGAYSWINGERRLTIVQAEPLWENEAETLGEMREAAPGTVTSILKGFGFTVKTGDGHLLVTAVQPEGRKTMDAVAFINGRGARPGDRLGGPEQSPMQSPKQPPKQPDEQRTRG
jgi:methionyl-tRNA formyltransferase